MENHQDILTGISGPGGDGGGGRGGCIAGEGRDDEPALNPFNASHPTACPWTATSRLDNNITIIIEMYRVIFGYSKCQM